MSAIIFGLTNIASCIVNNSNSSDGNAANSVENQTQNIKKQLPEMQIVCGDSPQMLIGTEKLGIISQCGDNEFHRIASITKIITALVVLDDVNNEINELANRQIITNENDIVLTKQIEAEAGTTLPISIGGELDEATALKSMLLASANNIADMLAIHHFGSIENYKDAAIKYAERLNLTDGVKIGNDASGLDDLTLVRPETLFRVGQIITQNSVLMGIVNLDQTEYPNPWTNQLEYTRNVMGNLHKVGFNGIKTGYTDDAGRTLLGSFPVKIPSIISKDDISGAVFEKNITDTIIVITLGDQNDANGFAYNDAQNIVNQLSSLLEIKYYE